MKSRATAATMMAVATFISAFATIYLLFFHNQEDPANENCEAVPAAWNSMPRIIIFGEIHGTNEAPRFVAELVCNIARSAPVTVGIEHPPSEQSTLDDFMKAKTQKEKNEVISSSPFWNRDFQDGKTSSAMLQMLERIKQLKHTGAKIYIRAIGGEGPGQTDEIFRNIMSSEQESGTKIVALVGNGHARKIHMQAEASDRSKTSPIDLKVIEIEYSSGSAWTCAPTCQIQRFGQDNLGEKEISLKVRASPAHAAGHPDWIYLGRSHASPPGYLRARTITAKRMSYESAE